MSDHIDAVIVAAIERRREAPAAVHRLREGGTVSHAVADLLEAVDAWPCTCGHALLLHARRMDETTECVDLMDDQRCPCRRFEVQR